LNKWQTHENETIRPHLPTEGQAVALDHHRLRKGLWPPRAIPLVSQSRIEPGMNLCALAPIREQLRGLERAAGRETIAAISFYFENMRSNRIKIG